MAEIRFSWATDHRYRITREIDERENVADTNASSSSARRYCSRRTLPDKRAEFRSTIQKPRETNHHYSAVDVSWLVYDLYTARIVRNVRF